MKNRRKVTQRNESAVVYSLLLGMMRERRRGTGLLVLSAEIAEGTCSGFVVERYEM